MNKLLIAIPIIWYGIALNIGHSNVKDRAYRFCESGQLTSEYTQKVLKDAIYWPMYFAVPKPVTIPKGSCRYE